MASTLVFFGLKTTVTVCSGTEVAILFMPYFLFAVGTAHFGLYGEYYGGIGVFFCGSAAADSCRYGYGYDYFFHMSEMWEKLVVRGIL